MSWSTFKPFDNEKYPMLSGSKGFPWLNEKERVVICPMRERWGDLKEDQADIKQKIWQLEKLGCEVCGEVMMPLDMQSRYFYVKYPKWLTVEEDCDETSSISLMDAQDRERLRINTGPFFQGTVIYTRYWPSDFREGFERLCPCVIDIQQSEEDDETIVWVDKLYDKVEGAEVLSVWDIRNVACRWLDEHYPDWKDPLAYWTETEDAPNPSDSGHADGPQEGLSNSGRR